MVADPHLAPLGPVLDPGTRLAGGRLARSGSWVELGGSERAVWGRCLGSSTAAYETVAVPGQPEAYACSCPSRKRPCKHVAALLLLWGDDGIGVAAEPGFVQKWLEQRARSAARTDAGTRADAGSTAGLADPNAAAQRAAARRERVEAGLEELDRWLGDQIRSGLAGLPKAGYAHFDAVAARMVDAQAAGVAAILRGLPAELYGEGWPERILHALGRLHLLVAAHRSLDALPADLAATVRSRIGYPVAKADVLATPGVADAWYALGAVDTVEAQLETRRVWLRGARTGRWAAWLAFAPPGQPMDTSVLPGQVLAGELHFYPGSGQHRALVGRLDPAPGRPVPLEVAGVSLAQVRTDFAGLVAADPWASRLPVVVRGVPVRPEPGEPWRWRDATGAGCRLDQSGLGVWTLLAHSCGHPIDVFGEWDGQTVLPLRVVAPAPGAAR